MKHEELLSVMGPDLIEDTTIKTDSYKICHWSMYPKGTEEVYSYAECRNGALYPVTPFFGLQYILIRHFEGVRVTDEMIGRDEEFMALHFGDKSYYNRSGWEYIKNVHGGRLPLEICAVPEGTNVGTGNVLMTVRNTDKECYWLTNFAETLLSHVWATSTVAAKSQYIKVITDKYLNLTSDTNLGLPFMLQDFGYRGVAGNEAAGVLGMSHLLNFVGSDTLASMAYAVRYYNANPKTLAFSVPASEHSIMTSLGPNGEEEIVNNLLNTYPTGILSVVSDSYDIENFIDNIIGKKFKDVILSRKGNAVLPNGIFVTRPDSLRDSNDTPEKQVVWIAQKHWENFGGTINSKGYKVIDPHVRILWGDGIDDVGINKIYTALMQAGFSAENIATFGMGGGLLQKINRDVQRFAFKSSFQIRNGVGYDIYKKPKDVSKISKRGKMKLVIDEKSGMHITVPESDKRENVLVPVFRNGELLEFYDFEEVRRNTSESLIPYISMFDFIKNE